MYAEAIALSEKTVADDPTSQIELFNLGYSYAKTGRRPDAEKILARFKELAKTQYVMSYWVAGLYAALGERDKAFAELEKALAEHDWWLHRLKVDPCMDSLRDDPRFNSVVKQIGL
jgi:tetratricopeptide (TPR) repeat protein